jgi:hypothetical protein
MQSVEVNGVELEYVRPIVHRPDGRERASVRDARTDSTTEGLPTERSHT